MLRLMRWLLVSRSVAGMAKAKPVISPVSRSYDEVAVAATAHEPMPPCLSWVLSFGVTAVPHSSSERVRLNCALTSNARATTQAGATDAMKSRLAANDAHDSTLHDPGSE